MIFSTRGPQPQIGPGMGFLPGSRALGGMTHARLLGLGMTVKHLSYAPGARGDRGGLGAVSQSMLDAAASDGIAASDLALLSSVGATDQDIENLMNNNVTLSDLYAQYGISIPSVGPQGHISAATMTAALNQGLDNDTLVHLGAIGATDADIHALMTGSTDLDVLMAKYSNTQSQGATINHVTSVVASQASTPQIPSGSTLKYTATYYESVQVASPTSTLSQLQSLLTSNGMSVVSSSVISRSFTDIGNTTIEVDVLDAVGHGALADAKSILDGLVNRITSNRLTESKLVVTSSPAVSGANVGNPTLPQGVAASATSLTTWFENNAMWIGLFFGGVFALNAVMGKRR